MRIDQKLLQVRNLGLRFPLIMLALTIPFTFLALLTVGRMTANQQHPPDIFSLSVLGPTLIAVLIFSTLLAALIVRPRFGTRRNTTSDASRTTKSASSAVSETTKKLSTQYDQQTLAMSALSEMDRAILSHASVDRLVDSVLRNAPQVINCPLAAVILIDHDVPTRGQLTLERAGESRERHTERCNISDETIQFLTTHPDGCALEPSREQAFLNSLADRGGKRYFVWPVYSEGRVFAIFIVGLSERNALTTQELTYSRNFADRLGVALWASALEEKAKLHANFDATTALLNRRTFKERLSEEIARARRVTRQIALLFVDLDQFKKINGSIGHAGGDALLEQVSRRLKSCLREEDIVARFGGDEFAILLPAIAEGIDADIVARKLIAQLSKPFQFGGTEHHLSASVGICIGPEDGQTVDALFHSADIAMYRAKSDGGGQYAFFEQGIQAKMLDRDSLEVDLREALSSDCLKLFYQPQIDLASGQIIGAEALIRWSDPKRGMVSPDEFINLAEQCGLIGQIGEFARTTACSQYVAWENNGIAPTRIAFNVSSSEFGNSDFIPKFENLLRESGVRPYCLEFEITESLFLDNSERVKSALNWLHDRGIHIAIDDFGTGYSSIAYLKRLPFDTLKLDRAFVQDIGNRDGSEELVLAILSMAKSLGKTVMAEGVETAEQRNFLLDNGCDVAQGFLWSQPLPALEFETFVREWSPSEQGY